MRPLLFAFALLLAACSAPDPPDGGGDAGAGDAGPTDAGITPAEAGADAATADGPCVLGGVYSSSSPTCNACAEERCCAEVNGCLLVPACNDDYVNCYLGCAFEADAGPCEATCAQQHPAGKAAFDAAIGCVEQACAAECG